MESNSYSSRQKNLQKALGEHGIDVAVLTSWLSIEYLTGLRSLQSMTRSIEPMPLVLPASGEICYVCPEGFGRAIRAEYPDIQAYTFSEDALIYPNCSRWEATNRTLTDLGKSDGVIGYEKKSISAHHLEEFKGAFPRATFVEVDDFVPSLRMLKEDWELDLIREASRITDRALERVFQKKIKEGMSEQDLEKLMAIAILEEGVFPSFIQIFVGGRTTFNNIAPSSTQLLRCGDIILFDFGVNYRGYCTDITRAAVLGTASPRQREVWQAIKNIFVDILGEVKSGRSAAEVDIFAKDRFTREGYAEAYVHRTGHGIGISCWEKPDLSEVDQTVLHPNMTLAVEQGIYLGKEGIGIRLEDNIIVTETGHENMNTLPLDLREL